MNLWFDNENTVQAYIKEMVDHVTRHYDGRCGCEWIVFDAKHSVFGIYPTLSA